MGLYVQLDANYPDHPKLIAAGLDGAGLHAFALCTAKRLESNGWIHKAVLHRMGATDELIDRLVGLRLFEVDGDQYRPWGWLDRNPSQGAIDAIRATKAEAAKAGNHKRWEHTGSLASCVKCFPDRQVVAPCDRIGSQTTRNATPVGSLKTETETETETTSLTSSENHSDREPAPVVSGDDEAAVVDEQTVRRAAKLIGEAVAHAQVGVANRAGYAAKVTKDILQGDGIDRERITRMLADGIEPQTIADGWHADPFGQGVSIGSQPGPDLKALYEAQQERTAEQFAEQHRDPPEATEASRADARAALRRSRLEVVQ